MLGIHQWRQVGLCIGAIALITACDQIKSPVNNSPPENQPQIETPVTPPPTSTNPAPENPSHDATTSTDPRVYWLQVTGDRLALVPEAVTPVKDTPTAQLSKLFDQLLNDSPTNDQFSSAIPAGTKLLSVMIQADGIVVNLSPEFESGGGSTSMMARVGQVLYTATSLDPKAAVWFQIEGQPLEVLGGEGLEIAQPMTRAFFTENFEL